MPTIFRFFITQKSSFRGGLLLFFEKCGLLELPKIENSNIDKKRLVLNIINTLPDALPAALNVFIPLLALLSLLVCVLFSVKGFRNGIGRRKKIILIISSCFFLLFALFGMDPENNLVLIWGSRFFGTIILIYSIFKRSREAKDFVSPPTEIKYPTLD